MVVILKGASQRNPTLCPNKKVTCDKKNKILKTSVVQGIHFHGPIVWSFLVDLMFSIHVNPVFFIAKVYQESCHFHPFPIHFLTESHVNLNSVIWNRPAMASCIGVASLDRLYSNLHRRSCFHHRLGSCWPFGRRIWKCSSSWFAVQQLQKTEVWKRPIVNIVRDGTK